MIIFLQENDDCHDEGLAFEKRVVIQVTSFYNKVNISISLVWIIPEYLCWFCIGWIRQFKKKTKN